ncbi:MAG TPA: hypothetical protein VJ577_22025 [Burkholderiaceae bacterium]|nr:hypothetical protein [Burkholderiaceae bacterium]
MSQQDRVQRYAAATRVEVVLRRLQVGNQCWLELILVDNGRGLGIPSPAAGSGLGLGLSATRSRSGKRLEILLLIGHLTSWLMRLIGESAQQCRMQGHFQSVPGLNHKEISVLTLARRVIDAGPRWLRRLRPKDAVTILRRQAQATYHEA